MTVTDGVCADDLNHPHKHGSCPLVEQYLERAEF